MPKHFWINPQRFSAIGKKVEANGMNIEVCLSPTDVPMGITGTYLKDSGEFLIQFDYQNRESPGPEKLTKESGDVRFIEGRHSGKLLSIIIPIDKRPFDNVSLIALKTAVGKAMDARSKALINQSARPIGPVLNAEAAQRAIDGVPFDAVAADLLSVGA